MELTSLRYFLAVADRESVTRAAEAVPISAGSLTKAVQALEAELGVKLFERVGRRIRLTARGRALQVEARRLLQLEAEVRHAVGGRDQPARLVASGEEALLGRFAVGWMRELLAGLPALTFEIRASAPEELVARLRRGEIHAAFTTQPAPADCAVRQLATVHFVTCAAPSHPLLRRRRRGPVPIAAVLEHGFAVPASPFLGSVGELQSTDGWRDDAFPRRVLARADTLHQLLAVVASGMALAYLPDYLAEDLGLRVIEVSGCGYRCVQPVNLLTHRERVPRWLSLSIGKR